MHAQRLEYTIVDKVREVHAGQRRHDVRTNHEHLLSTISYCQNQEVGGHYLIIVLPLFAKLESRAQISKVSRYVAHTFIWPVRVVVAEGKNN
jgi:hypothetical protein